MKFMLASYDKIASTYDFFKSGDTRRWREAQLEFFKGLYGRILYVGMGTGQEIVHFPSSKQSYNKNKTSQPVLDSLGSRSSSNRKSGITDITAIDISVKMVKRAEKRILAYGGLFQPIIANVENLGFRDETFDCALTVCTFCTVVNPVTGFQEIKRVLKPGGTVFSFEHVMSGNPFYGLVLKTMTPFTRLLGTHLDRDTMENLQEAGLEIVSQRNIYLDIVKAIVSRKTR